MGGGQSVTTGPPEVSSFSLFAERSASGRCRGSLERWCSSFLDSCEIFVTLDRSISTRRKETRARDRGNRCANKSETQRRYRVRLTLCAV